MPFHYSPISFSLTVSGLLSSVTNLFASRRTSMMLFRRAKAGARGKEATKSVTKPNWITGKKKTKTKSTTFLIAFEGSSKLLMSFVSYQPHKTPLPSLIPGINIPE